MTDIEQQIKETGATFTPENLANFLSERIFSYLEMSNDCLRVLDPACGEGALLAAMSNKISSEDGKFELLGFDSNKNYINKAKNNLSNFSTSLHCSDFLDEVEIEVKQPSLFQQKITNKEYLNNSIDIVIANPPYVRTQILGAEKAQALSKKFNLKGRVDLYYPFLIAMTHALKENGVIGVITSNRYLVTKSGNSVRKFLFENFEILEVIDLGDTKLFDAAILPAIFIGRKKKSLKNATAKFSKIYEELNGYSGELVVKKDVFEILNSSKEGYFTTGEKRFKKSKGLIKFSNSKENNWSLLSESEAVWVGKIEENSCGKVSDSFKVRVGIKTTADKVFIKEGWEELGKKKPEETLLKELISQENIKPWTINSKKKLKVLYPYIYDDGSKLVINVEDFPKTKDYFKIHEDVLKARKYVTDAGRNWFEIWVPQNPLLWKFPKLVFPDISPVPRFYFDNSGKIVNGNCYWIVAENKSQIDKLLLIQGVSNSNLMTKYHDLVFGNKLYSGRRRYFSQYVKNYPLPNLNSKAGKEIVKVVKKLNMSNGENKNQSDLITQLEIQVANAFGVEPVINQD